MGTMMASFQFCGDELPDISPITDLDNVPSFDELTAAFASTRENNVPGSCGIPAEVWKHGGKRLQEKLHELIVDIWRKEQMPQNWKDAIRVNIHIFKLNKNMSNNPHWQDATSWIFPMLVMMRKDYSPKPSHPIWFHGLPLVREVE